MTTGPIRGHVLSMMSFMLVGMFLQTLYALVDIYWVAHLGKEAVAAVALASNLMFVVLALSQTLSVGAIALISQAFGRKDEAEVQRLFNQSQAQCAVAAVLFLIGGLAVKDFYAQRLASDLLTAAYAREFLAWFIPSQSLLFLMAGIGSALRGIGNMKPGLIAQSASVLLNMLLAPILILGWLTGHPLGVSGAGLATFIATLAAVIGMAIYLGRASTYLRVDFSQWRPDWKIWRRLLGIGLPSGAEFLLMSVILGLIYVVIRPFGAEAQAGFGIGMRIMQAGFMPAVALSFAVAAVAGQNFGALQNQRVRKTFTEGAKLNIAFMLFFTGICHIAPERMVGLFSQEPAVVQVGAEYLRFVSYNYVFSGLIMVAAGLFQGVGNTLPSLIASASRLVFFVLPVLWLAQQPGFQLHQVWWVSVVSVFMQMLLSLALLRREFLATAPALA
ncbi:MAG: MATE family efflux transporter [Stagnimonas sp.]|nr:MATE family efflux transporter [Stagnimonas sp.]